jgi:hypothetical protein
MPQDPTVPQNPEENSNSKGEIDLNKILLPKKNGGPGKTLDSAGRVSAGALLEQEQTASLPKQEVPPLDIPRQRKEESIVKPIETYQGDIESLVEKNNVSVVSIAAAEAARRAAEPPKASVVSSLETRQSWKRFAMVMGGILFVAIAVGLVTLIYIRTRPVPLQSTAASPFIIVDATSVIALSRDELTRPILMAQLEDVRSRSALPLGLIGRTFVAETTMTATGEVYSPIGAEELISILSVNAPAELLRTLEDEYLLGVHSFDDNQSFLIVRADSYTQAYAGMLAWERFIQTDLAPLFTRTPRPRTLDELGADPSPSSPQAFATSFEDAVVENHDARVLRDPFGDMLLVWTFLDRNTIILTTNEYTLREVLSRFATSPNVVE